MSTTGSQQSSDNYTIALLGYSRRDFQYITGLINMVDMTRQIKLLVGDLSKSHDVECDLVIAILDSGSNIGNYINDVALVKQNKASPAVICAAHDMERQIVDPYKNQLLSDALMYMPIQIEQFTKTVQTLATKRYPTDTINFDGVDKDYGENNPAVGKLGDLLVQNKIISKQNLAEALDYQKKMGLRLGNALIELGFITEDQKLQTLAKQLKTTVAEPHMYSTVDINIAALIPEHIAKRFGCLALDKKGRELTVVTNDAFDLKMLDMLRDVTDMQIIPILGRREDIATTIERCYRDISTHMDATQIAAEMEESIEVVKKDDDDEGADDASGNELGIIKLVNVLISNAIRDRASDIHIEPMENEVVVRYRIDGDMRRVMSPPKRSHHAIVARIKILSELNIAERRLPQDGRMAMKIGKREVDIRVSILPTIFGEKAVLRILDKEAFDKSTSNLGFSKQDESVFRGQCTKPYGIIIVTGPTGSGKSTTLYSALQNVKSVTRNVITVEDPVEFHMEGINQVHVNTKIGLTFSTALRSILRQDPDVILIGEIRDAETADIAIKMALTGHLVFSTLHTNDAASAIVRFTDIGIPPLLLGSSLNLIVAQRLVRRICVKCKTQYVPDPELLHSLNLDPVKVPHLYKGTGCVTCNGTGFQGRVALFEMLQVSKDIRKLILKGASTMEIQDKAIEEGMCTLRQAGINTALSGTTTIEQIIAATMEI